MPTELPYRPWDVVGTDLSNLDKWEYIVVVDYYSSYPEVLILTETSSACGY